MEKKKVSFIISSLGGGGAERVLLHIANEFVKSGHVVNIYTFTSSEVVYPMDSRIIHRHLDIKDKNKILRIIKRFIKLRNFIKNDDSSTIISFDGNYGVNVCLFTGKKVIVSERNDPHSTVKPHSMDRYFRDWSYRHADVVVFQTDYAKEYFPRNIQEHGVVIPNPVSKELALPYLGNESKDIIAACRLTPQKNVRMMIDAFVMFEEKYPGYKLKIFGEGELRGELEEYIADKCPEKVLLPGYVKNLSSIMQHAFLYVSSSDYEGISNSMLEALAVGVPSVCTDCPAGGARMVINSYENGILIPVKQTESLYKAMCELTEDLELRNKLSRNSVKIVDTYAVDKICGMWSSLLK